ncbi:MAG: DUF1848 domain-containing protein [Eubacteriaceae bacterium]|nr:DUF1848 domain-containing protein [Eubacteriaceae bacterium]
MIINTGQRTDIPAFYAKWFATRLKEGTVCVRNPFNAGQVSRYLLDPNVVDVIGFCTKNPESMMPYMDLLDGFGQVWSVTMTPYGRDIEPNVPEVGKVIESFRLLSQMLGQKAVIWRYDPIFLTQRYTEEYHLKAFRKMASLLENATDTVVISFIDLYPKVRRYFPEAKAVPENVKIRLGRQLIAIASEYGMRVKTCGEGDILAPYGADASGCMTISDYERAIGQRLKAPKLKPSREGCSCYLSCDIGAYNSCEHFCRYCYANVDRHAVLENMKRHDPRSPLLIGQLGEDEWVHDVKQVSWINRQIGFFDNF